MNFCIYSYSIVSYGRDMTDKSVLQNIQTTLYTFCDRLKNNTICYTCVYSLREYTRNRGKNNAKFMTKFPPSWN